jgi:hypothetical protein
MTYNITYIPYGRLSATLPTLMQYLYKSEPWTGGRASVDDIVRYLYIGQMQLWAIFDQETLHTHGYVITEIKQYPQYKMFVWQYGAGEPGLIENTRDLVVGTLEQAAKDSKCDGMEIMGRPGWKRAVREAGFVSEHVLYEKFFE